MKEKTIINICNVSKNYYTKTKETKALKDINLNIKEGEFVSIVGPSGCGKTTLLSILAKISNVTNGKIEIKDGFKVGYMFQSDVLFEWRTVYENCMLGLELNNKINEEKYIDELLKQFGIYEFKNRYPHELSGGMKQRVSLIRTLVLKPDIILLDEPFSALDYLTRLKLSNDVWKSMKEMKKTVILVTHNINEAISFSDRIVVLTQRPCKIKKIIDVDYENKNRNMIFISKEPEFNNHFEQVWKEVEFSDVRK